MLSKPAEPSAHRISAVGHAHIDSAWLWPLRETVRKVARTTANMTALLEDEPDFIFTMSQAPQYDWIKEHRPEVYAKVKKAVADGRFVPAGGMWVESDTNMPGSEAMARQFVHGKRFFLEEFGVENDEAWLPDTFGFAGGLPQIIKAAGSKWLLTQKISWSQINKFPHHTFLWEGIDGTRIFTHFPPVDTYNCSMKGSEIAHAARNFKDKGRASVSLAPTGWGDGGGGTTREMIAKAARMRDLEGSAKVVWEKPAEFFAKAAGGVPEPAGLGGGAVPGAAPGDADQPGEDEAGQPAERAPAAGGGVVVRDGGGAGRGPRTPTRSWTGSGRRYCCTSSTTSCRGPRSPGCIGRRRRLTRGWREELKRIIGAAQRALAGATPARGAGDLVFNSTPHARRGVAAGAARGPVAAARAGTARAARPGGGFVLANGLVRVEVDGRGLVVSAFDLRAGREDVAPGRPRTCSRSTPTSRTCGTRGTSTSSTATRSRT